ncbi:MAG: hypothetical protein IKE55_11000 [Kiritimatiellae bacterium]|nr:hypothetical protein [Kiritimatiellia bacterium]
MAEYVKMKPGVPQDQRMHADDWTRYAELVKGDECPDGFLPVRKVLPRPEPGPGQKLAWTYAPADGEMVKEYFLERTFSKLKLYAALASAGLWDALETWLKTQTVNGLNAWTAFQLAQELRDDHPLFASWYAAAKSVLGVTDAEADAILDAAVEV